MINLTNGIIARFIDEVNSWVQLNNQVTSVVWSANNNFDFDSENNIYYVVSNPDSSSGDVGYNCVIKIDRQNGTNSIVGGGNIMPNNNCKALKLSK